MTQPISMCSRTLLETGNCECWATNATPALAFVAYPTDILHSEECEASSYDGERYATRFGDVCCSSCHAPLAWAEKLVRDGIYGDGTGKWIAHTRQHAIKREGVRK